MIEAFVEPSKETEPVTSPERLIVLAFCNVVAVDALPTRFALTVLNITDALVATSWPMDSVFPVFVIPVPATMFAAPVNCVKVIASVPMM